MTKSQTTVADIVPHGDPDPVGFLRAAIWAAMMDLENEDYGRQPAVSGTRRLQQMADDQKTTARPAFIPPPTLRRCWCCAAIVSVEFDACYRCGMWESRNPKGTEFYD